MMLKISEAVKSKLKMNSKTNKELQQLHPPSLYVGSMFINCITRLLI